MSKVPMTPEGHQQLQKKLKHLKSVERPTNIADIETARAHGDLSENAEYSAAKEKQLQISDEIKFVEHQLASAQIIDPSTLDEEKVVFGATVTLDDIDSDEERCYKIVGSFESNINEGKISIESPIARSLIGKEEGDVVKVKTPNGIREFEIVSIEYK